MADPLSAVQTRVAELGQSSQGDAQTRRLRQLWSEILHAPSTSNLESLRSRALRGEVPIGDRPTLRWIHWKLFLSRHLSNTPSSWTAVLDKDRNHYAALRRDMLRAPDGNFPPGLGLDDDPEVMAQISPAHRNRLPSRPSLSRTSSVHSFVSGKGILGDLSVNNPLSLDDSNPWKAHYASLEIRQTIAQDVERTFPELALFRQARVQQGLTNALFVWCRQNEDVGYRQGMHELMAVLWLVRHRDAIGSAASNGSHGPESRGPLNRNRIPSGATTEDDVMQTVLGERWVEHDVFTMFCVLMLGAKSWFEWKTPAAAAAASPPLPRTVSRGSFGSMQPPPPPATPPTPIVAKCERIRELLHTADPSLAQHLDSLGIEPQLFALRWIRLIFTREFPLEDALKVWDGLFAADPSLKLVDQVCLAMLMRVRNELLSADYSGALQTLMRYPVDAAVAEGSNKTELLVRQAIYLRDNGATPTAGVAIVMLNRDLLGIPPRFPDASRGTAASGAASDDPLGSSALFKQPLPSREASAPPHSKASPKFATVGRSPSGANPVASWQRPSGSRSSTASQPPARRFNDPLSASSNGASGGTAQLPARSFGIVPSAYIPEGISEFARGLYERSDSLGINRALNSTMANVQRTVAAAAAGVATSGSGSDATGNGGFPSSFSDSLTPSVSNASLPSVATVGPTSFQPSVPRCNASTTVGRASGSPLANATTVSQSEPVPALMAKLNGLASTNSAIGTALSTCIEVLETSWLARREAAAESDGRADLDQCDVDTLMSFTALKHIRDVLTGTAKEFDPATLPIGRKASTATSAVDQITSAAPSSTVANEASSPKTSPATASASTAERSAHAEPVQPPNAGAAPTFGKEGGTAANEAHQDSAAGQIDRLPMSLAEYLRYGRQMIQPDFGLERQLRLRQSKVLVVGAGGLGCPAIQYLAAAGVGQISILDHDNVELSNLARQILHSDAKIGMNKAESAARAARTINPFINAVPHPVNISSSNARSMISCHDLVLDCTDNPLTRYLISDAAVLEGVQVVSGAAQGYDGQLIVLHKKIKPEFAAKPAAGASTAHGDGLRGPCYRCLFPVAPKPEDVTDCEDGGVLGGVTGLVGTMQALEAVKILAQIGEDTPPTMTLVSPMSGTPFRTIKIRPRRIATCRSCGDPKQVGRDRMIADLEKEDYVSFCGLISSPQAEDGRRANPRITVDELEASMATRLLIDVRPPVEFGITKIDGSINIPYMTLRKDPATALETVLSRLSSHPAAAAASPLLVCRRGNDSQLAARLLQEAAVARKQSETTTEAASRGGINDDPLSTSAVARPAKKNRGKEDAVEFSDLVGGLRAYAAKTQGFPMY
ncbi:hypothetical protein ACQY0O_005776 [Thecaphora frezii]|nr:putative molybdenum cofactor synthesis protein [Thecaphora frezii]